MTDVQNPTTTIFNEDTPKLTNTIIETVSLEDILAPMIRIVKTEIEAAKNKLDSHQDMNENIRLLVTLLNGAEAIQIHFEFTVAVLKSESEEEVETLKEKYSMIRKHYDKVKSREDFSPLPAKYGVAVVHEKLILEFKELMKKCFKQDRRGATIVNLNNDNIARAKILIERCKMGDIHYPMILTYAKDDVFCFEKSSPVWQELYRSTIFKQVLSKEEIKSSFKPFHLLLHISHLILSKKQQYRQLSYLQIASSVVKDALYYGVQHSKAETDFLLHLTEAQIEEAFHAWNLIENPVIEKALLLRTPSVQYDELIYVPRLFPAITEELIFQEYEENTINKIHPMDPALLQAPEVGDNREEVIRELFKPSEEKVPVRILAPYGLDIRNNRGIFRKIAQKASNVLGRSNSQNQEQGQTIVIHMHGGGFVSMSSASHRVYLSRWVNSLELVHFSIDYRLAPKNKYPDALDDVWQAYLWIINYAKTVLGINPEKIIFAGDSAGGNLAIALIMRLIRAGLQPPHGCLLIYPCLSVDKNSHSPSYFRSIDDPLLPYSILKLVAKAYVKDGFKNLEDPFISPMVASDELLQHVPPIRIVTGSNDPLHDDSWRLLAKLIKLKKNVKLIVHEHLSHAYMCHQDLKNYKLFVEETCELIEELISL